ncbi:MAG: hypothetical protein ACP5QO_09430 [Clostridia bacterium]
MGQFRSPNSWGTSPRGVGALIAVLVRYPEVSSLDYHADEGVLALTVSCRSALNPETFTDIHSAWDEGLHMYRECLRQPEPRLSRLEVEVMDSVSNLILTRDVESLTVEEVGLTIEILREETDNDLVADPADLVEEELLAQEENIQATLESLRDNPGGRLFALREEGRVLVFNS